MDVEPTIEPDKSNIGMIPMGTVPWIEIVVVVPFSHW